LKEILSLIAEDAAELNCEAEVKHARKILKRGTSAHRQVEVYNKAMESGLSEDEAARKVVKHLIRRTGRLD